MERDRTLLSRHELKYLVTPDVAARVRETIQPFMALDPHSRRAERHRYRIASLYLDGPELPLHASTERGLRNRYKLRIRSYADDPGAPVFCEVKRRSNRVVRKLRARSSRAQALKLILPGTDGAGSAAGPAGATEEILSDFARRCQELDAAPTLNVRYHREAYESRGADPLRISFDTDVEYSPFDADAPFRVGGDSWCSAPLDEVVMEIKFTDRCPSWVHRMVNRLGLTRCSVPKYVLSMNDASARRGESSSSSATGSAAQEGIQTRG